MKFLVLASLFSWVSSLPKEYASVKMKREAGADPVYIDVFADADPTYPIYFGSPYALGGDRTAYHGIKKRKADADPVYIDFFAETDPTYPIYFGSPYALGGDRTAYHGIKKRKAVGDPAYYDYFASPSYGYGLGGYGFGEYDSYTRKKREASYFYGQGFYSRKNSEDSPFYGSNYF